MFSRRPTKKLKSAPVLGQVPSQRIPAMNRTVVHDVGYYNENVQRTPRLEATANLFQAIQEYNDPEMVQRCLDNGADVNYQDVEGKTGNRGARAEEHSISASIRTWTRPSSSR